MATKLRIIHKSCMLLQSQRSIKNVAQAVKRQLWTSQPLGTAHVYSAVCVERVPVVTPEMTKLEKEFADLMSDIELENSKLSDHEVRHILESSQAQTEVEDTAGERTENALDLEDKWNTELRDFPLASRTTSADQTNDVKSRDRRLDSSLYLLVKQCIEGRDHWVMPQVEWQEGETMRQTAERALKSVCGEVEASFLGNAPCGVAKFALNPPVPNQEVKLFFYKAWYRQGEVKFDTSPASDYVWVTRGELAKYCFKSYRQQVKKFIL